MKKRILVLVCLALVLVFSGTCWSLPTQFKGTTLTISMLRQPMTEALRTILAEFERETGIKVEIEDVPYLTMREKQIMDLTTRSGAYDLLHIDNPWIPEYVNAGYLYPLDSFAKKYNTNLEGFVPLLLKLYGYWERGPNPDQLIAFPFSSCTIFQWYRKDMFKKYSGSFQAKYGRPLTVPATPEEYRQVVEFFNGWDWDEDGKDEYGVGIWGLRGEHIVCDWLPIFWGFGDKVLDENYKVKVNSPAGINALEFYVSLKQYAPPGVGNWGHDEVLSGIREGTVAITGAGLSEIVGPLEAPDSPVKGKIGYAPLPWTANAEGRPYHIFGGYAMGVSKFSKNPEAAFVLLDWATNESNTKRLAKLGAPPCRTSAFKDPELLRMFAYYPVYLESLQTVRARPRIPEYTALSEVLALYLSEALVGIKTPKQALDAAAAEMQKIIDRAGYTK